MFIQLALLVSTMQPSNTISSRMMWAFSRLNLRGIAVYAAPNLKVVCPLWPPIRTAVGFFIYKMRLNPQTCSSCSLHSKLRHAPLSQSYFFPRAKQPPATGALIKSTAPSIDHGGSVLQACPALKTRKGLYVLVAHPANTTLLCKLHATLTSWAKHCETLKKEAIERAAWMEKGSGWIFGSRLFSRNKKHVFMLFQKTMRFCFAFQSMWMNFGMCCPCAFCRSWPQWLWMAAIIFCGLF